MASMKLIPNNSLLMGKRVAFCDDSIVRGTQLMGHAKRLYDFGTQEVHIRISCPPLLHSCPFLNFTASQSEMELVSRRIIYALEGEQYASTLPFFATTNSTEYTTLVNKIKESLSVDSLLFNHIEALAASITLPKEHICTHCFDGSSFGA